MQQEADYKNKKEYENSLVLVGVSHLSRSPKME
jgi:hypothetical protein